MYETDVPTASYASAVSAVRGTAATAAITAEQCDEAHRSAAIIVGYAVDEGSEVLHTVQFPSRPEAQSCEFFVKTGYCKFAADCCFHHPAEHAVQLTAMDLPFRPGQAVCPFYLKTNQCKFGPPCKFHHPHLKPIYAGSAAAEAAATGV